MSHDNVLAVKFDAFAVAMQAKAGGLEDFDVDSLVAKAEQLLGSDHPVARAVMAFATQYQLDPRDAVHVAEHGDILLAAIDRLNVPEPPDMGRRDIYG